MAPWFAEGKGIAEWLHRKRKEVASAGYPSALMQTRMPRGLQEGLDPLLSLLCKSKRSPTASPSLSAVGCSDTHLTVLMATVGGRAALPTSPWGSWCALRAVRTASNSQAPPFLFTLLLTRLSK